MPQYLNETGLAYFTQWLKNTFATQTMVQNEIAIAKGDFNSVTDPLNIIKTGKIYTTKVWKYTSNQTSDCVKMDDNANLICTPYTDTTDGIDDYEGIPLFMWWNCNYERDRWGCARLTYLEGEDGYSTTGGVDVGVISPMMYIKFQDSTDYELWSVSDTQHDSSWIPWFEGVTKDNNGNPLVLPYYIGSKYFSGQASDGKPRSQSGLSPISGVSHNNMITNYQTKGAGYWGAGSEVMTFHILMNYIKYGTKNSQAYNSGCMNYNYQYPATVTEDNVERIIISKTNAANLVVGSTVSIGNATTLSSGNPNNGRGQAGVHAKANRVKITAITDYDSSNSIVAVDNGGMKFSTASTTVSGTTCPTIISTMPWISGSTDDVRGKHDGAVGSNTDSKHPYRIQGREYMVGGYQVAGNTVTQYDSTDNTRKVYVASRGISHSNNTTTIGNTYTMIGKFPSTTTQNYYVGDVHIDLMTGGWHVSSISSSSTQGFRDYTYYHTSDGWREYLMAGVPGVGASGGSAFSSSGSGLGDVNWGCLARD